MTGRYVLDAVLAVVAMAIVGNMIGIAVRLVARTWKGKS